MQFRFNGNIIYTNTVNKKALPWIKKGCVATYPINKPNLLYKKSYVL